MTQQNSKPAVPWTQRMAALIAGTFALPLLGEIFIALQQDGTFNFVRTAIIAVVLGLAAAALYASEASRVVFQRARAAFLIFAGLAVGTQGFLLSAKPDIFNRDATISGMAGISTLLLGLATFAIGWFYFNVEAKVAEPVLAPPEPVAMEDIHFDKVTGRFDTQKHTESFEACRKALSLTQLHYVAYYEGKQRVFNLDVFEKTRFTPIEATHADRRLRYNDYGPQIIDLVQDLNNRFNELETGPLVRLVFDVKQGAIYYYRLNSTPELHLFGVTLDQAQIHTADDVLEKLADELRVLRGLLPIAKQPT